jgi:predicted MarR family transcription regulator
VRRPAIASGEPAASRPPASSLSAPPLPIIPNHREREFMQRLRGHGWVKAAQLPAAKTTLKRLLEKRWVERQGIGRDTTYRITDEGITAKTAPIPLNRP